MISGGKGAGKTTILRMLSDLLCGHKIAHQVLDDGKEVPLTCVGDGAISGEHYDPNKSFNLGRVVEIHTSETTPKDGNVLMSSDNHEGWKLEDLLDRLGLEVAIKSEKINEDPSVVARTVTQNNEQIIGLLIQAAAIQRQSYIMMSGIRTDDGPTGNTRIGNKELVTWLGMACEHQSCQWETSDDSSGEPVLVFCNHQDNPEDTEGNCRVDICPFTQNEKGEG